MKKSLIIGSVAAVLAGFSALAQEKTPVPVATPVSSAPASSYSPASYSPNDIKILGTISSGQTSSVIQSSPKYHALVFEGNGHDQVDITVTGANHKAYIALADATLTPIVSGMGRLDTTLPYHGPDTEAFYILIKGATNQRLSVHLKKIPAGPQAPDATK